MSETPAKLTELEPRWVSVGYPAFVDSVSEWADRLPIYRGVTFLCPHCRKQRLGIMFEPPINTKSYVMKDVPAISGNVWRRESGDTFDTLTLSPSLDFSQPSRIDFQGHWHGFIKNGDIL